MLLLLVLPALQKEIGLFRVKPLDGDFEYVSGVKLRKARRVKNFKQDLKINKELYEIASQFI